MGGPFQMLATSYGAISQKIRESSQGRNLGPLWSLKCLTIKHPVKLRKHRRQVGFERDLLFFDHMLAPVSATGTVNEFVPVRSIFYAHGTSQEKVAFSQPINSDAGLNVRSRAPLCRTLLSEPPGGFCHARQVAT